MCFLSNSGYRILPTALATVGFVLSASFGQADVGIGTELPNARLHVVGESAQTGQDLRIENLDPPQEGEQIRIVVTDEQGYFHTIEPNELSLNQSEPTPNPVTGDDDWRASITETVLTVDSAIYTNNRVGIGVTIPAYELDIEGDIRATGSLFASNHVITHATFATSDERFKRDIRNYDDGLDHIRAMQPKRFRYTKNAPGAPSDRVFYGLIAQEAESIDPNLVQRFELPSPLQQQTAPTYLGVDSQRLVFTLISAVKALDDKDREIDALRVRVEALEARIAAKPQPRTARHFASTLSRFLHQTNTDTVQANRWNAFLTSTHSTLEPQEIF